MLQRLIGAEIDKASDLTVTAEEADPTVIKMFLLAMEIGSAKPNALNRSLNDVQLTGCSHSPGDRPCYDEPSNQNGSAFNHLLPVSYAPTDP